MAFQMLNRRLAACGLIGVLVAGTGGPAAAQPNGSASDARRIEGTWRIRVTLRNCSTGAALATVDSIVTFARGGTMSETPGGTTFAPGKRSDGHGLWQRTGGQTYLQ